MVATFNEILPYWSPGLRGINVREDPMRLGPKPYSGELPDVLQRWFAVQNESGQALSAYSDKLAKKPIGQLE